MSLKTIIKNNKILYAVCKPLAKYPLELYRKLRTKYGENKHAFIPETPVGAEVIPQIVLQKQFDSRELFFQENSVEGFNRFDIIVRLLAIENFYEKNDFGFDLYKKMQTARMGKDWTMPAVERFKALIASYHSNGYDRNSAITIDSELRLQDGSHRMALSMFFKKYWITAVVQNEVHPVAYGMEWFIENDFTDHEMKLVSERYSTLKGEINQLFVCTLWSSVSEFFDDIVKDLEKLANVVSYKDYVFSDDEYRHIVYSVYSVDDIEQWKVDKKLEYMNLGAAESGTHSVRIVNLLLDAPDFRLKDSTKNTLSMRCEKIKRIIRNKYKAKISNYFYDIILHIGDNFYQNAYIRFLFDSVPDTPQFLQDRRNISQFIMNKRYKEPKRNEMTKRLDAMLPLLQSWCDKEKIALDKICIVGSSVLSCYGIRENHDIDLVMTSDIRNRYGNGTAALLDGIELVSENWARSRFYEVIPDDELIANSNLHFIYQGFKFANLDLLFERKLWQRRDKDCEDILRIIT